MWVYNSDIHKRYIWEFRPVKVIMNIVWHWIWATYINLFIWRKNQNGSLHKESIQNHTRLKQYVLIQFRNVHEEFHKYIIFRCLYNLNTRSGQSQLAYGACARQKQTLFCGESVARECSATHLNYFLYRNVMNVVKFKRHSKVKVIQGLISAGIKPEHIKLILMLFPLYVSRDRKVRNHNLSSVPQGFQLRPGNNILTTSHLNNFRLRVVSHDVLLFAVIFH